MTHSGRSHQFHEADIRRMCRLNECERMKALEVNFSTWTKWQFRERLSEEFDVPEDFGILSVYLLASPQPSDQKPHHLANEVFYIGMSSHVTSRLDKSHKAVCQYRLKSGDDAVENLYFSLWSSDWSNSHQNNNTHKTRLAYIQYVERKLIWEYANRYGELPSLNGN